jgi:hypothetical protein
MPSRISTYGLWPSVIVVEGLKVGAKMQRAIVKIDWPPYTRRDLAYLLEAHGQVIVKVIRVGVGNQSQELGEECCV